MNSIGDENLGNSFLSIKSSIELFCSDCVLEFSKDEISFIVVWLFSSSIGVTSSPSARILSTSMLSISMSMLTSSFVSCNILSK